jgi:hypothetical protein
MQRSAAILSTDYCIEDELSFKAHLRLMVNIRACRVKKFRCGHLISQYSMQQKRIAHLPNNKYKAIKYNC